MAHKMFLKLEGVRGQSENPRHHGEIEIYAFSWGGDHPQVPGGPGKASIKGLTISKRADRTSPILWVACHSGQYFKEAVLTVEEISEFGSMIRWTAMEMKSLNIESITSRGEEDESVTFKFDEVKMKHS